FGGLVGLRAGESGARIAPEPIDTRKKKESRASIDRTLSVMQCPTLFGLFWACATHSPATAAVRAAARLAGSSTRALSTLHLTCSDATLQGCGKRRSARGSSLPRSRRGDWS